MKIAIPSVDDKGLDSFVEQHFGRAKYYTIIELKGKEIEKIEVIENPFIRHSPGEIPRFLKSLNVDVAITGGIGRRAVQFFEELGINIVSGVSGKISDVVKAFIEGELESGEPGCPN